MSDTFRKEYRELSEWEADAIYRLKNLAGEFEAVLSEVSDMTDMDDEVDQSTFRLAEAVMWGVKAITG